METLSKILIAVTVVLAIALIVLTVLILTKQINWANSGTYISGFRYEPSQKIFTTRRDALQRMGGYSDVYDLLSVSLYMPIDVEPIIFDYNGQKWKIELWKGQYFMATGCEIGIYLQSKIAPGRYYCAPDDDMLHMSYELHRNGELLFKRDDKHWWLTGFRPGIFTESKNLAMENIVIECKDKQMAQAFYNALVKQFKNNASEYKYKLSGNKVMFRWQIATPELQPRNKSVALGEVWKDALVYDQNMTEKINAIMKDDYSANNINNVLTQLFSFMNTDDNSDAVINYMEGNDKGDLSARITTWDTKNNTNIMSLVLVVLEYLQQRWDQFGGQTFKAFMKFVCGNNPVGAYFKSKSPILSEVCDFWNKSSPSPSPNPKPTPTPK